MKKNIIILEFVLLFIIINLYPKSYAVELSINNCEVNMGESATISVDIPEGYVAYEGKISYDTDKLSSNGSDGIIKVADVDFSLEQVSDLVTEFTSISVGSTNINVDLVLCKSDGTIENASGTAVIKINENTKSDTNISNTNNISTELFDSNISTLNNESTIDSELLNSNENEKESKIDNLNKENEILDTEISEDENSQNDIEILKLEESVDNSEFDENVYNQIIEKVGIIPEVGKNYNIYFFDCIVIISIVSIYKIINNKE